MTPSPRTLVELLRTRAEQTPHAPAFSEEVRAGQWRPVTWADFAERVHAVCSALVARGLRRGDRVALMAPVSLDWEIAQHALLAAGAVVVGLDAHDHPDRVGRACELADLTCFVVADAASAAKLPARRWEDARLRVCMAETALPGAVAWADLLRGGGQTGAGSPVLPTPGDEATVIFTSGTTGDARGIAYTHEQVLLAVRVIAESFPFVGREGRMLCWLPLSNLFQRVVNLAAVHNGACTAMLGDPRRVLEVAARVQPDVLIGVPRLYEKLLEGLRLRVQGLPAPLRWLVRSAWALGHRRLAAGDAPSSAGWFLRARVWAAERWVLGPLRAKIAGPRLRLFVSGSAPLPLAVLRDVEALGWPLLEAYGLSENVVPMAMNTLDVRRRGSVGRPVSLNAFRLDEAGQLWVRGPGVCAHYLGAASAPLLDADGWYATGDLAHIDEDGFVWLRGRTSELIKTSTGRRISPLPIEMALRAVPGIEHAWVVGNGRKALAAICVCLPGGTEDELVKRMRACQEAAAQRPPAERVAALALVEAVFGIESGELTPNLKLRRAVVTHRFEALIDRLYELAAPPGGGVRCIGVRQDGRHLELNPP